MKGITGRAHNTKSTHGEIYKSDFATGRGQVLDEGTAFIGFPYTIYLNICLKT